MGIFVDLKKAFDTIKYEILLQKLKRYGIIDIANYLLRSYLTNRKQYVNCYNHSSKLYQVTCGIPQDSILEPFRINLYINYIANPLPTANVLSYAYDTALHVSHTDK